MLDIFFDNTLHQSKKTLTCAWQWHLVPNRDAPVRRLIAMAAKMYSLTTNTSVMKKLDLLWTSLLAARFCQGGRYHLAWPS